MSDPFAEYTPVLKPNSPPVRRSYSYKFHFIDPASFSLPAYNYNYMYNPEENWRGGETTRGQIAGIDMTKRLEGKATEAVDIQFMFAAGISLPTTTDGPLGAALCRAYNKWAAKLVKGYRGRTGAWGDDPCGLPR